MSNKNDQKTRHLAIIGGVIGSVLGAHGATPLQTLTAVTIGFGVYKIAEKAIEAERNDPPGSWKKRKK